MLIVELVHPLLMEIDQQNPEIFQDCAPQCLRATRSVMDANLLLFKTVIAGDSWGLIAVPVIQQHPLTAVIFMGSLMTLVFGVLNIIVAVVVDTFAEVRESDVMNLAQELDHNLKKDRKFLQKIFNRLDKKGDGELTLQDLMDGARQDPEFQSRLRVMDIDEVDLQQLFDMIDADGSGAIEAQEFIAPLSRWVHESKTAPRFIKYNMMQALNMQEEMIRLSQFHYSQLAQRLDSLQERFGARSTGYASDEFFECDESAAKQAKHHELVEAEASIEVPDGQPDGQHRRQTSCLETVEEEHDWTPEMVGAIEQPQRSQSKPLQSKRKDLEKPGAIDSPTESEPSRYRDQRKNSRSRDPSPMSASGFLDRMRREEEVQLPDHPPQDSSTELPEPSRVPDPSRDQRTSSITSLAGFWDRVTHKRWEDEVHTALSQAMQAFQTHFEASLTVSADRAMRQSMAKAEAVLQERFGNYNMTSWNVVSSVDKVDRYPSSCSTTSLANIRDSQGSTYSRQVSRSQNTSRRVSRISMSSPPTDGPRPNRLSQRLHNGVGPLWDPDP